MRFAFYGSCRLARWAGSQAATAGFWAALCALVLVYWGTGVATAQPMANSPEAARTLLTTQYKLTPTERNRWLLPGEVRLLEALESLPRKLEAFETAERDFDAAVNQNRQAWNETQRLEQLLQNAQNTGNAQEVDRLQRARAGLPAAVHPNEPGESPVVVAAVTNLLAARQSAQAAVLEVQRLRANLPALYAPLEANEEIQQQLSLLGGGHRLGPQRYEREFRQLGLAGLEDRLASMQVPVVPLGYHLRVGSLLEDRTPLTFVLNRATNDERDDFSWITSNELQRIGLDISPNAPIHTVTIGSDAPNTEPRTFSTVLVQLPSLRIGGCELTSVDVFVLPPEGEDIGSHLSEEEFLRRGYQVERKPAYLILEITRIP